MKQVLHIIKIGGHILEDSEKLKSFLSNFAKLDKPKILVHGGGKAASDLLYKLGIAPKMVNGRRITDAKTLEIVTMVYAGSTNKSLVAQLQGLGVDVIGLSGADLNVIQAKKREVGDVDYGFAGDIVKVNSKNLKDLLDPGFTPVLCSITHDKNGQLLNTNADTIASAVASSMAEHYEVHLTYCFEKPGILKDIERNEIYPKMDKSDFDLAVKKGKVQDGILPKITNSFDALESGVKKVRITAFDMINDPNSGTIIE